MKTKYKQVKLTDLKYKNIKKSILEFCDENEDIDEHLIDELVYNYFLADSAKQNIETHGVLVNVVRDPDKQPLYQSNQAIAIYNNALKNITMLLTKLALTPQERKKLETTISEEPVNQLDKDMQDYD